MTNENWQIFNGTPEQAISLYRKVRVEITRNPVLSYFDNNGAMHAYLRVVAEFPEQTVYVDIETHVSKPILYTPENSTHIVKRNP